MAYHRREHPCGERMTIQGMRQGIELPSISRVRIVKGQGISPLGTDDDAPHPLSDIVAHSLAYVLGSVPCVSSATGNHTTRLAHHKIVT
jgi:hypothetical protein